MVYGVAPVGEERAGYGYRGLVVRAGAQAVLERARALGFTGWVGPQEGPDVVVVAAGTGLFVADGGRDLEDVGAEMARLGPTLLVTVVRDRLLALVLLREVGDVEDGGDGVEALRYLSEPSVLDPDDDDQPRGEHHAGAMARAFGVPGVAGELRDVLAEALDPEHYIESERLGRVLALLGLPGWLVSSWTLPRPMSVGPARLTRLRAGKTGPAGVVAGWAAARSRRARQVVSRRPDGPRPDGLGAGPGDDVLW
ncbi:hypothetical protein [Aquipuribacter hungaricus]|uniref:PucR family transcriptional regulator n=1 Tax=Aquipuribacter hungaricus TaxID=545624 RepID=A0ABV7WD89_9MICO